MISQYLMECVFLVDMLRASICFPSKRTSSYYLDFVADTARFDLGRGWFLMLLDRLN